MRNKSYWLAALFMLSLSGCATLDGILGRKPPSQPQIERETPRAETPPAAPAPTPEPKKKGGYYLDDGPGDNPPADIDAIPDAVPRAEPLLSRANRPYMALGESYTPMTAYQPYRAEGIASWYGRRYHGQKTSSGEVYDMYGMTAAHPILPIPSFVRVTNPENGKSVVVRVNDRGPFKKERLIDLSYAAAYKLRLVGKGSGMVAVEAIDPGVAAGTPAPATPVASPPVETASPGSGSFIQAGAFKRKENADQLRDRLRQQGLAENIAIENWYNDGVYRVRLGPYPSRDEAMRAAGEIKQSLGVSTLVISQ